MLDVAIVGGGVCGLALARGLAGKGVSVALFEARERLGGRVLSVENRTSGQRLDLGPTWLWPASQPAICALLDELGLARFDQHDPGTALLMADPEEPPAAQSTPGLHGGAQRVAGGMGALVEALAAGAPAGAIRLRHALREVRDCGGHVELAFAAGGETATILAKRAVLAVPPRLLAQNVAFAPALPAPVEAAMHAAPTWMASSAKAVMGFAGPPVWRAFGCSGNAFVVHDQATLGEVFDACDASGEKAAIGGFFALSPEVRKTFQNGLSMLAASQFVQLFGKGLEQGELHMQDWAGEPFTCASSDLTPGGGHPDYGARALSQPLWGDKLYLGASETAREGGGYVEGAINAAARIEKQLAPQEEFSVMSDLAPGSPATNHDCIERFRAFVASRRAPAFAAYRQRLNYALSHGERDQLTQRALLGAMEATFADALGMIDALPFDHAGVPIERGRSELTPKIQGAFEGFIQGLLDEVIDFNRTSCALSNFPAEHRLQKDYVSATLRDVAAAWREFSLAANDRLIVKPGAPRAAPGA